jgi:hypothetical protein
MGIRLGEDEHLLAAAKALLVGLAEFNVTSEQVAARGSIINVLRDVYHAVNMA